VAVNDYDWCLAPGKPYLYRFVFGLLKPKHQITGFAYLRSLTPNGKYITVGGA
jgi:hypothetical protein